MKDLAEFIRAITPLSWPIFAFIALFMFKKPISDLLGRLNKVKVSKEDVELTLGKLNESAKEVEKEAPLQEKLEPIDDIKEVIGEAAQSPKAALILLSAYLERETRQLLASLGHLKSNQNLPLSKAIEVLQKQSGGLPGHIPSSLKFFEEARNKLIHGGESSQEDILRAIDSGITILKALKAVPKEINVVYHPGVNVFQDQQCKIPIPNVKGVILETESPGGISKSYRIFPTTRSYFLKGKRVSWEWSFESTWGPAWYKDPDTQEIKPAWTSSAEFVGRPLDDV